LYADPGGADPSAFGPTRIVYPTFENQLRYDKRNRVVLDTTVFGEEGLVTRYRYDLRGQVNAVTDPNGKTAFLEYDALGRLSKFTDKLGNVTTYGYDNRNNPIAVRDANGHQYSFAYDRANRLVQETRPQGQSTRYAYDATDNLIEITRPGGERVQYDYDEAGRLSAVHHVPVDTKIAAINYSFTHDQNDNVVGWSDGQFSATLTYDDLDRKLSEKIDYAAFALTYAYSYTANDLKKTLTLPSGVTYTYSYDDNDELAGIDIPGQGSITVNDFFWRAPKRVTLPGGTTQEMGYDGHMKLESLGVTNPAQQVVADLHNRFGKLEELTERQLDGTTTDYGYDNEQRLTTVALQESTARNLTLDPVANRLGDTADPGTWSYDENNRLIQRGAVTYSYDSNGNLASKTDGTQVTRYFYDVQNRLSRIEDGAGAVIATYGYDPLDRRLWKEANGVRKYFLYADEGLLGEYTADGGEIFAYGWRPDGIWGAYPLFIKSASQYFYAHNDQLGTPLKLTDRSGSVVWSAKYDVFGQMTLASGATIINNLRFAGQYFDEESGLHYNFRRYYDPKSGRYIAEDPIGMGGGINLYAYVNGDPTNRIDPNGEFVQAIAIRAAIDYAIGFAECFAGCMGAAALMDLITGNCFYPGDDAWPCALGCAVPPFFRKWPWFKPPCGRRNSFAGDTLVHTEEGLKPIKDIKVGDKVLAWAEWKDEYAYKPVTWVITGEQEYELIKITLENGDVIEATPGHPLYVHGEGWREAYRIGEGAELHLKNGETMIVKSVTVEFRHVRVYNLEVADYHTFGVGADGFFAHNATNPPLPSGVQPYQMDLFPKSAYDRVRDYGYTPTSAQRSSVPPGTSYDHNPTLVKHYYEGDGKGGLPGYNQTQQEREAFAKSLAHGKPATIQQQHVQGGKASAFSKKWRKAFCLK
jgi:RHS repeat-associated protein